MDAVHNPSGARTSLAAVREAFPGKELVVVLAVFADKGVDGLLRALAPGVGQLIAAENTSSRHLPAAELASRAATVVCPARVCLQPDLGRALDEARASAVARDTVLLVTGSVVTAGEALTQLPSRP